jgi:hypothetical protein
MPSDFGGEPVTHCGVTITLATTLYFIGVALSGISILPRYTSGKIRIGSHLLEVDLELSLIST